MKRLAILVTLLAVVSLGFIASTPRSYAAAAIEQTITTPYSGQSLPFKGQAVTISGSTGTTGVRTVRLQKYSGGWSTYATTQSDAEGNFSFQASTTSTSRRFRAYAPSENGLSSVTSPEVKIVTQSDSVSLTISRLGNYAVHTGKASPVISGRVFTLQVKSGDTWQDVATDTVDASGMLEARLKAAASTYRWVGEPLVVTAADGTTQVTITKAVISSSKSLSLSPKQLGKNVLYVNTLNGGTPTVKGVDYAATAVIVSEGAIVPISSALSVETIVVRGNSSATKPKKPYKLKFSDKQKPFGMKSDKTWILLANYGDRSLIRSRVAFELGRKQSGLRWTPDEVFTELFLNGKYLGSYQIIQSIKIDNNRVNIDKELGQVMEHDPHWVEDETEGFVGPSGMNYSYKDPDTCETLAGAAKSLSTCRGLDQTTLDPESLTPTRFDRMKEKIKQFEKIVYSYDWSSVNPDDPASLPPAPKDWMTYLEVNSAVDYILTREFTKDNDADFYRSNFFNTNSYLPFFNTDNQSPYGSVTYSGPTSTAKMVMGPIWDFDRSAGAAPLGGTGISNTSGWWTRGTGSPNHDTNKIHWFTRIWKDVRFQQALKARWAVKSAEYKDVYVNRVNAAAWALDGFVDKLDPFTGSVVANNDRTKWPDSYGSRYAPKSSTFVGEINWLRNWYKGRYEWMNAKLTSAGAKVSA